MSTPLNLIPQAINDYLDKRGVGASKDDSLIVKIPKSVAQVAVHGALPYYCLANFVDLTTAYTVGDMSVDIFQAIKGTKLTREEKKERTSKLKKSVTSAGASVALKVLLESRPEAIPVCAAVTTAVGAVDTIRRAFFKSEKKKDGSTKTEILKSKPLMKGLNSVEKKEEQTSKSKVTSPQAKEGEKTGQNHEHTSDHSKRSSTTTSKHFSRSGKDRRKPAEPLSTKSSG